MATSPQRPIAPPRPRSGSGANYVLIALLLLALIVVAGGTGVWIGLRILSNSLHVNVERDGGDKNVSIQTPLGSLKVNHDISEAGLGLPIYPGATPVQDNNSATVNIDIFNQAKVRVFAGKFETRDSLDKVRLFYHDRLGDQVTKFTEKEVVVQFESGPH